MADINSDGRVNSRRKSHCKEQQLFRRGFMLAAASLLICLGGVQAQVIVWTGQTGNNNWSIPANWNPTNVPNTAGEIAQFTSGGQYTTINQNVSGLTIGRLEFAAGAPSRTISGNAFTVQGINNIHLISNSSATQTITANVNFYPQSNGAVFQINNGMVDLQGVVNTNWYANVLKTGDGTLRLGGNNTFQGDLIVQQGLVIAAHNNALGNASYGNTVHNGATLALTGGITVNQSNVYINGTGVGGQGALRGISGTNTWTGTMTTQSASLIGTDAGSTLNITGTLALDHNLQVTGGGFVHVSGNIHGSSSIITKTGEGILRLSGSNPIQNLRLDTLEGTVELDRNLNTSQGPIIGTTSGPAATLKLLSNNRVRDDLTVTIHESGLFDLNGYNESIAALSMSGGKVNTNGGVLTLANAGGDVIVSHASSQTAVITGTVNLNQDNLQLVGFNVENGAPDVDLRIDGAITKSTSGTALVRKTGEGTLEYAGSAANTYVGITQVNEGTLLLNKASPGINAIAAGSTIEINGGTLLLGNSHQIANNVAIKMSGGTFATSGHSDVVGTLTLTGNSTLDLGEGASVINFASSASQGWSDGRTLVIENWNGNVSGGGTDQVIFGSNNSSLTSAQLGQILFHNPHGLAPGYYGAIMLANGEIVPIAPIPEPSTWLAGGALVVLLAWFERKRFASWFHWLKSIRKH